MNFTNKRIHFCHEYSVTALHVLKMCCARAHNGICGLITAKQEGAGAAPAWQRSGHREPSPGVICGKAGGAAPAWGSQPGLCLAFIFNTLLPGGDKPSLSEVIAN